MLQRTMFRASRQVARPVQSLRPAFAFAPVTRAAPPSLRCYSDAAPAEIKKDGDAAGVKEAPKDDAAQLREQLEKKDKEVIDLKDKYLRSVADYRNLQERTKREIQTAKDFALKNFTRDLVETVDTFDRALGTVDASKLTSANPDLVALHDGLKMTDNIFISTLKKHGLERFDPSEKNEKFDPNVHEAVFQTPMPDKEDGVCFHTQQKGFLLNGRVLRAAKVGVVKNS